MNEIAITPLRRIGTSKGDVLHGLKSTDIGFTGFGEAYFSAVLTGMIKGWKRHRRMTLNMICIQGAIRFVAYQIEHQLPALDVTLSPDDPLRYARLTIPPLYWVGFQGISPGTNMLLNIADLPHDPTEADTQSLEAFTWPN